MLEGAANEAKKKMLDGVSADAAAAKFKVLAGLMTEDELLAQERTFENRRYQIEAQALQQRLALLAKDPTVSKTELAKLQNEVLDLTRQHEARVTQIEQQAILQRKQIQLTAGQSIAQSWAQNISKMITLQQSFGATIKGLWQSVQQAISSALASILEQWLAKKLATLI